MKYGNKMVSIMETHEDVWARYNKNHMSKDLNIEDNKSEVKVHIQNKHINMYVMKEMEMLNNIDSIYSKIWKQCTYPLQNMINHIYESTVKQKGKYMIYFLNNIKTVYTWIDSLGDEHVNYFNCIKYCLTWDKGILKETTATSNRRGLQLKLLLLSGGRHVLCSPEIMEVTNQENPPEK